MQIEIWSVGKASESFISEGINHYFRKTTPYCTIALHILELPKKSQSSATDRVKKAEEEMILRRVRPEHYLILLDERGTQLTSIQWADHMQQLMNQSVKTMVLLVGGAFGVTDKVRRASRQCWSLSPLVFPHQLVRLIVAEQVYRACSILNNAPYHHA